MVNSDSLQYGANSERVPKNSEENLQKISKVAIGSPNPPNPKIAIGSKSPKGGELGGDYTSELGKKMRERMHHMRDNFSYKDFISKFLKRD